MKRLENKVALVTGAAQGIGRGISLRLAQEGADIAMNVRQDDERARSAREEILACGVRCELLVADVSDVGPPEWLGTSAMDGNAGTAALRHLSARAGNPRTLAGDCFGCV